MNKKTTSLYSVEDEHAMGGEHMFPTATEAREYAIEVAVTNLTHVSVSRIDVATQPCKQDVCDIFNRTGYAVESTFMYLLSPNHGACLQYSARKERDHHWNNEANKENDDAE